MNTKLLVILTLVGLCFGCQPNQYSPVKPEQKNVKLSGQQENREVLANGIVIETYKLSELRSDRSNYKSFKQNLNVYETKITIPEHVFTSDLEISRTLSANSLNPYNELVSKADAELIDNNFVVFDRVTFREADLDPKAVTYKVYTNETLNGESSAILIPDLIVDNSKEAVTLQSLGMQSGQYEFGVIVFENHSVLRTEGTTILLKAKRVFAENASVESYSFEYALAQTPDGEPGKNGGRFALQTEQAWGSLTINMRGTLGGKGFPATAQTEKGADGAKGENGRREKRMCESVGVKSVSGKTEWSLNTANPEAMICEWICYDPKNGANGSVGPDGLKGGTGMLGGMSGSAEVYVYNTIDKFNVTVTSWSGIGGVGGDGSPGGIGGMGGAPGDIAKGCDSGASAGLQGASGAQGAQGDKGEDGRIEKSSIVINGEIIL